MVSEEALHLQNRIHLADELHADVQSRLCNHAAKLPVTSASCPNQTISSSPYLEVIGQIVVLGSGSAQKAGLSFRLV
jgi:hypothetical protein